MSERREQSYGWTTRLRDAVRGAARQARPRWRWIWGGWLVSFALCAGYALWLRRGADWNLGLPWERALLLGLDHDRGGIIDAVLLVVPWFGTNFSLLPVAWIAAYVVFKRGRGDLALHVVVTQLGALTLNQLPKFLFDRDRPHLWAHRGQYAQASYPSGHMIASVAILFTFAVLLHRERGWRWPYVVAAAILGISLYSRLYLGVHWPSDVIAGLAMGAVWLAATLKAFPKDSMIDGR